jgi:hypothetical protein
MMQRRHGAWLEVGLIATTISACTDDGPPASDGSTGEEPSTGAVASTAPMQEDDATITSGVEPITSTAAEDDESDTGGGGLPDYSDSQCWGDASVTSVYNGMTHQLGDVAATCRAEGDRVLLYVADGLWGSAVDQAAVNALMHQLELFTPKGSIDPTQGVVPNDEAVFGAMDTSTFPRDKLEIYVVDTSGAGEGYLCGWCDYPQLHMDGLVLQPLDGDHSVAIAAHETYHVIHEAYDADEEMWVNESLAEAAMTANGFFTDMDWLESFTSDPDQDWGPGGPEIGDFNYGAALLWGTALWERGGATLMTAITAEPANGWDGIDAALDFMGDERDAWDLYLDMVVAVYVDEPELGYGFASFDLPPVVVASEIVAGSTETGSISPYGIDYHRLAETGDRTIELVSTGAEPVVGQVLIMTEGVVQVVPIEQQVTAVIVGASETAVVALTARGAATYELSVD